MNKAIFLDKDGTLIRDIPYNVDPSLIVLTPNAVQALTMLQDNEYMFFVVSNQTGLALGHFTLDELEKASLHLCTLLFNEGVGLDAFYYCPHRGDDCSCHKPAPGLLLQAALDHDLDLSASWMIGDILNDVEAGHRAGCHTILLDNGNETEWRMDSVLRIPDHTVSDLRDAADIILSQTKTYAPDSSQL
jgi:D-glycero-D-manno-heptose 1,7-bisphosphate phosphatase